MDGHTNIMQMALPLKTTCQLSDAAKFLTADRTTRRSIGSARIVSAGPLEPDTVY